MLRRGIVIIAMVALFFGQMMTAAHAHDDHGHDDEQQASCVVCLAATAEDDLVSDTGLDEPTGDGCGVDLEFIPASLLLEDAPATLDFVPEGSGCVKRLRPDGCQAPRAPPAL